MGRKPTRKTKAVRAIKEYVKTGYSANEIQRRLREQNIGMRRKRILEEIRLAKNAPIKKERFRYVPIKYRPKDHIKMGATTYLFRCSLILNDVPVHSKPFQRNYLGFRLQAFSVDEKMLKSKMQEFREILIQCVEQYLKYPSSEWWFASSTYIGYEYPSLTPVSNPYFLNNRWIFRVEKEGREVDSRSGVI